MAFFDAQIFLILIKFVSILSVLSFRFLVSHLGNYCVLVMNIYSLFLLNFILLTCTHNLLVG